MCVCVCVCGGGEVDGTDGVSNGGLVCHFSCDEVFHKSSSVIYELLCGRVDDKPTKK